MGSKTAWQRAAATLRELDEHLANRGCDAGDEELGELQRALDQLRRRLPPAGPTADRGDTTLPSAPPQHEAEKSLRITQESVDAAPIGIFRLDAGGHVVSANREACRALGYSREELQSLTIFDFDPAVTPERWAAQSTAALPPGAHTFNSVHRRKDGSLFPVEISVKQFHFEGELYSVSFAKDVTERVNAEQERARLEARMLQAQKLESLGVLAGGIAHDFNNLLMTILGNLELASCELPASAGATPMLGDAQRAAQQAADLCRQLLIYAGKGTSKIEPTDLGKLLREQAHMLEVSASKSTRLLLNLADELPLINADVSQLRQVFMNLIINASDAIGQAPGVITITTAQLVCERDYLEGVNSAHPLAPGPYITVEVSDTGCGMDADVRSRIFDPFFSTKTAGRGLGLAAVRGIVSKHGGGIRVYSEPGKGTTFRLLFPVPAALEPATESRPALAWQGSGLVLVIDDEPLLLSLGTRMLRRLGFDTLVAGDGREGMALFRARATEIAYVLLDWTMPAMSGEETLRELRRLKPDVRVVLASGHAPDDLLRRVGVERVSALVRKPYTLDELARAFQRASGSA